MAKAKDFTKQKVIRQYDVVGEINQLEIDVYDNAGDLNDPHIAVYFQIINTPF